MNAVVEEAKKDMAEDGVCDVSSLMDEIVRLEQEVKELKRWQETVRDYSLLVVQRDKAWADLAELRKSLADPVGIVRMSPKGNPIPKWIMSADQSTLKDGDLLFSVPKKGGA